MSVMRAMITRSWIRGRPSDGRRSGACWPDRVCGVIACSDLDSNSSIKKKGGEDIASPLNRIIPGLLQDLGDGFAQRIGLTDLGAGGVVVNNASFVGAERASTRRTRRDRPSINSKRGVRRRRSASATRCGGVDVVAALQTGGQSWIDQAGYGCCCTRATSGRRAENREAVGEADAPRGLIRHLRSHDRADRADSRRLVSGHLSAEQVRNRDRRDDQNNRDDDQQLDQRKTLLFLIHCFSLERMSE